MGSLSCYSLLSVDRKQVRICFFGNACARAPKTCCATPRARAETIRRRNNMLGWQRVLQRAVHAMCNTSRCAPRNLHHDLCAPSIPMNVTSHHAWQRLLRSNDHASRACPCNRTKTGFWYPRDGKRATSFPVQRERRTATSTREVIVFAQDTRITSKLHELAQPDVASLRKQPLREFASNLEGAMSKARRNAQRAASKATAQLRPKIGNEQTF